MKAPSVFGICDYIIIVLVLLISTGIGIYYRFTGGKQETVKGSLIGLTSGMVVSVWLALAPKPPLRPLPTSVDGCSDIGSKFNSSTSVSYAEEFNESDYPWLYRVSYLYNGVIGLIITFCVGYLASFIIRQISGKKIEDEDYDPNLFAPPLSRRLLTRRKDNAAFKLLTTDPSENVNSDIDS